MFPHRSTPRTRRLVVMGFVAALAVWAVTAYIVMPRLWAIRMHRHPALADAPTITHTGSGIPGDALNVALIGSEEMIVRGMIAAGWHAADPITFKSSERIVVDTILHRPYEDAPVSNLYLWGRKEDLAYEQPIGDDPKMRHHVRFWKSDEVDDQGYPLWMGAATKDERVGLSDTTGQVTHHISPDIDAERDLVIDSLQKAGWVASVEWIDGFQNPPEGRNGGGDPWHTDGRLGIATLRTSAANPTTTQATTQPTSQASNSATKPAN